jgi:hypothetical protein
MKTKTYRNYLLLISLVIIGACNSFLDEPSLEQSLPLENNIETSQDVKNALIGAYSRLSKVDCWLQHYSMFRYLG